MNAIAAANVTRRYRIGFEKDVAEFYDTLASVGRVEFVIGVGYLDRIDVHFDSEPSGEVFDLLTKAEDRVNRTPLYHDVAVPGMVATRMVRSSKVAVEGEEGDFVVTFTPPYGITDYFDTVTEVGYVDSIDARGFVVTFEDETVTDMNRRVKEFREDLSSINFHVKMRSIRKSAST